MKKQLLLLFIIASCTLSAAAQTDSLNFVKAKWETKKIASGVKWKHCWFKGNLFGSNQNINVLEIKPHGKYKLALGYEVKVLKPVADFAAETNAIGAINGGFFDVKNGGSVDLIKVDGIGLESNHLPKSGARVDHQKGALLFNNGILSIAKWDGSPDWESKLPGDLMVAGPMLIYHNVMENLDTTSAFIKTRNPRTGVAVTKNIILLITIDGRNENAAGVTIVEMAKIVKWLNAQDGINLDGGGSTTMWVKGITPNNVVNYPTDNKKWDHEGARKVANVVLVQR
ncbi:MAG: phosphodiester glycosidase family protein [Bacteroidota bacterium]|jgi:exopolysaccharide biosynthesis protein